MKKFSKILSVVLLLCLLCSAVAVVASATDNSEPTSQTFSQKIDFENYEVDTKLDDTANNPLVTYHDMTVLKSTVQGSDDNKYLQIHSANYNQTANGSWHFALHLPVQDITLSDVKYFTIDFDIGSDKYIGEDANGKTVMFNPEDLANNSTLSNIRPAMLAGGNNSGIAYKFATGYSIISNDGKSSVKKESENYNTSIQYANNKWYTFGKKAELSMEANVYDHITIKYEATSATTAKTTYYINGVQWYTNSNINLSGTQANPNIIINALRLYPYAQGPVSLAIDNLTVSYEYLDYQKYLTATSHTDNKNTNFDTTSGIALSDSESAFTETAETVNGNTYKKVTADLSTNTTTGRFLTSSISSPDISADGVVMVFDFDFCADYEYMTANSNNGLGQVFIRDNVIDYNTRGIFNIKFDKNLDTGKWYAYYARAGGDGAIITTNNLELSNKNGVFDHFTLVYRYDTELSKVISEVYMNGEFLGSANYNDTETLIFSQYRWVINNRQTFGTGMSYSLDNLAVNYYTTSEYSSYETLKLYNSHYKQQGYGMIVDGGTFATNPATYESALANVKNGSTIELIGVSQLNNYVPAADVKTFNVKTGNGTFTLSKKVSTIYTPTTDADGLTNYKLNLTDGSKLNMSLYTDLALNLYIPETDKATFGGFYATADDSQPLGMGELTVIGDTEYYRYSKLQGVCDWTTLTVYAKYTLASGAVYYVDFNYGQVDYVSKVVNSEAYKCGSEELKLMWQIINYKSTVSTSYGGDMTEVASKIEDIKAEFATHTDCTCTATPAIDDSGVDASGLNGFGVSYTLSATPTFNISIGELTANQTATVEVSTTDILGRSVDLELKNITADNMYCFLFASASDIKNVYTITVTISEDGNETVKSGTYSLAKYITSNSENTAVTEIATAFYAYSDAAYNYKLKNIAK